MPFFNRGNQDRHNGAANGTFAGAGKHPGQPQADTVKLVPLSALCPNMLQLQDGSFVRMLEIPPLSIGATGADFGSWLQRYEMALLQLPPGLQFQVSVLMEPCDPQEDLSYFLQHAQHWLAASQGAGSERQRQAADALAQASQQMTAALAGFYDHTRPMRWRLVITLVERMGVLPPPKWSPFGGKNGKGSDAQAVREAQAEERLDQKVSLLVQAFRAAGLPVRVLSPVEMGQVLWRALHPEAAGQVQASDTALDLAEGRPVRRRVPPTAEALTTARSAAELGELLAPDTVVEREDTLEVDGTYLRGYILYDFKPYQPALLYRLSELSGGWVGSLFVDVTDPMTMAAQLDARQVQVDAGRMMRASRGVLENYTAEMEAGAVKESRARLAASGQPPILVRLVVLRSAADLPTLEKRCRDLESVLTTLGVRYYVARYRQLPVWQSTFPTGTLAINQAPRNLTAQSLATFFWPPRERQTDAEGMYVGIDEDTGLPVRIDFLGTRAERTPSVLALGRPGAGKSVTLRTAMLSGLIHGATVMAVDLEGEMRAFVQQYGGRYIEIGAPGGERINILDIPPDSEDPLTAGTEHLIAFCAAVRGAEIPPGPEWNTLAESYRMALIDRGWLSADGQQFAGTRWDAAQWDARSAPRLVDIVRILERQGPTGVSLAEILRPYAEGVYAPYFNHLTTVDIAQERLVVFGLQHVNLNDTGARLRVYLWQIMGLMWGEILRRQAANPSGIQMVLLDELWAILAAPGGAGAIENMARRFRKRRAVLWMATQQTGEFLDSPVGQRILNITGNTFLMEQRPPEARRIQQVLGLSDGITHLLERIGTGRGIWVRPEGTLRLYVAVPDTWGVI